MFSGLLANSQITQIKGTEVGYAILSLRVYITFVGVDNSKPKVWDVTFNSVIRPLFRNDVLVIGIPALMTVEYTPNPTQDCLGT